MEAVGSPGSSESPLSTLLFPTHSQQKTRIKKFSQAWEKKSTTKKADKKVLLSHLVCTLWGVKNEAKPLFPRTELFIFIHFGFKLPQPEARAKAMDNQEARASVPQKYLALRI